MAGEFREDAEEWAEENAEELRTQVREQPITSLLIAGGIGAFLGAIFLAALSGLPVISLLSRAVVSSARQHGIGGFMFARLSAKAILLAAAGHCAGFFGIGLIGFGDRRRPDALCRRRLGQCHRRRRSCCCRP